ncbi:MAG: DUF2059 domain-containing protein [Octadecabacter sp.]|nr:DUF2059 domain-containing protein [Octadecabacter sp.]
MIAPLNRIIAASLTIFTLALPATAQTPDMEELFDLLQLPDIVEIMREEGVGYGESIGEDLFAGPASPEWVATVEQIYNLDRMLAMVEQDFAASLDGDDIAAMTAFIGSERGQRIIGLEVSARRALLDDAVEDASKEAAAIAATEETDRYAQVRDFIESNNLIETNVAGALNTNYAFYMGLMDGQAFGGALTEEQVLSDVWSQEAEIRTNTTEWLYAFLLMAYQPLSDEDLLAYTSFSETDAGRELNRALFEGFDRLFEGISRSLGRAAANEMTSAEL